MQLCLYTRLSFPSPRKKATRKLIFLFLDAEAKVIHNNPPRPYQSVAIHECGIGIAITILNSSYLPLKERRRFLSIFSNELQTPIQYREVNKVPRMNPKLKACVMRSNFDFGSLKRIPPKGDRSYCLNLMQNRHILEMLLLMYRLAVNARGITRRERRCVFGVRCVAETNLIPHPALRDLILYITDPFGQKPQRALLALSFPFR